MRAMKDSGIEWIGEVPQDWQITRAKNCFAQSFSKGNEELTLLSATQADGVVPKDTLEGVVQVKEDSDLSLFKTVHKYDYVISLRSFQGGFEMSLHEGVITPAYTVFRAKHEIDYYYFRQLFKSDGLISKINSLTVGIREGKNIMFDDFADSLIPVPPLSEQTAIANFLDKKCGQIDGIIEKQKAAIERLKAYKQSVITEAVTGKVVIQDGKCVHNATRPMKDSGIEWIGQIPQEWEVKKMKFLVEFNPNYNDTLNDTDEVAFAPMECIGRNSITPKVTKLINVKGSYTYFADGDIIMAKVTPCFENGNIALAKELTNGTGFGTSELHVFRSKNVYNVFLLYYLQNTIFKQLATATMYGTGGLKRVSSDFIVNHKITMSPHSEQIIISKYLDKKYTDIDMVIQKRQKLIDRLTDYKKSLIYEAVTDKIEIQ